LSTEKVQTASVVVAPTPDGPVIEESRSATTSSSDGLVASSKRFSNRSKIILGAAFGAVVIAGSVGLGVTVGKQKASTSAPLSSSSAAAAIAAPDKQIVVQEVSCTVDPVTTDSFRVEIPDLESSAYDGCAVLKYYDPRDPKTLLNVSMPYHYDPAVESNYVLIYGAAKTENAVAWVYNFDCGLLGDALFEPSAPLLYTATCNSSIAVPPQCQGQPANETYVFPPVPNLEIPEFHCGVHLGGACNSTSASDCCNLKLGSVTDCSSISNTCQWACQLDTPCLSIGAGEKWTCKEMYVVEGEAGSNGRYFCSATQDDWEVRCVNSDVCVGEWEYCTCPSERPCLQQYNSGVLGTATSQATHTTAKSCVALNSSTGSCNGHWSVNRADGSWEDKSYMDCTK